MKQKKMSELQIDDLFCFTIKLVGRRAYRVTSIKEGILTYICRINGTATKVNILTNDKYVIFLKNLND